MNVFLVVMVKLFLCSKHGFELLHKSNSTSLPSYMCLYNSNTVNLESLLYFPSGTNRPLFSSYLTLIGAAYFWGSMFDRYDGKFLFSDGVYCSLLNTGTTYNSPADRKLNAIEKTLFPNAETYMDLVFWNDGNLNKNINRFFEITDKEIYEKMNEYLKSKN